MGEQKYCLWGGGSTPIACQNKKQESAGEQPLQKRPYCAKTGLSIGKEGKGKPKKKTPKSATNLDKGPVQTRRTGVALWGKNK